MKMSPLFFYEGDGSVASRYDGDRDYNPPLLDRPRSSTPPDSDNNSNGEQVQVGWFEEMMGEGKKGENLREIRKNIDRN